jgi:SAM-dependent methyltransferase
VALDCWQKAGVTVGKRVLDVGAGPGYAALDLAEIVGPRGEVVAIERSKNFVRALKEAAHARSLTNIKIHELDLMTDDLPKGDYDFSWCRWVASFVNDPALLVKKLTGAMQKGSIAIFHEYGHYETWHFFPRLSIRAFPEHVIDVAGIRRQMALRFWVTRLAANGFVARSARCIFCVRPNDYMGNGLQRSSKFISLSDRWD